MPTTPSGNFALLQYNLETLIASSATFQTAVGATGDTASKIATARGKVYWLGATLEGVSTPRPFAWIKLGDGLAFNGPDSGGAGFMPDLKLKLLLEFDLTKTDTASERQIKFWNFVGGVVADMLNLAKTSGYLELTQLTLADANLSSPKEAECYGAATFDLKVW